MFIRSKEKSREIYTEDDGKYYRQHINYSEKYGIWIPQARKRISEKEYYKMLEVWKAENQEG